MVLLNTSPIQVSQPAVPNSFIIWIASFAVLPFDFLFMLRYKRVQKFSVSHVIYFSSESSIEISEKVETS